jgi:hypothetical protein
MAYQMMKSNGQKKTFFTRVDTMAAVSHDAYQRHQSAARGANDGGRFALSHFRF